MKEDKIKVLIKRVGEPPIVKYIENDLRAMQEIVGGMIELPPMPDMPGVSLCCNEEGKLENLPANIHWGDRDIICGDFFIVSHNDEGESISLTDKEIEQATKFILENDASGFEGDVMDFAHAEVMAFANEQDFWNALMGSGKSTGKPVKSAKSKDDIEM